MSSEVFLDVAGQSPLHGYRGERAPLEVSSLPLAPSYAISREVGARGGEIARRLGARLGWQVFDREMLEYGANEPESVPSLVAELPPAAAEWIEQRMRWLHQHQVLSTNDAFERLARLILAVGAHGEAIFIGTGAGFILPRESTLHIRVTAPLPDRISYMSQLLRLSRDDAAEQVRQRSAKRDEFLKACFRLPLEGIEYDMTLNSSALGEDLCARLAIEALACKAMKQANDSGEFVVGA